MLVAIHDRPGGFSDRWVTACQERDIPYRLLNLVDPSCWTEVIGCDVLMAQWAIGDPLERSHALRIVMAFESAGGIAFPNSRELWHFDDKLGQHFLAFANALSFAKTHVFFTRKSSLSYLENAEYPHVFKLAKGAGSHNVQLVKSKR